MNFLEDGYWPREEKADAWCGPSALFHKLLALKGQHFFRFSCRIRHFQRDYSISWELSELIYCILIGSVVLWLPVMSFTSFTLPCVKKTCSGSALLSGEGEVFYLQPRGMFFPKRCCLWSLNVTRESWQVSNLHHISYDKRCHCHLYMKDALFLDYSVLIPLLFNPQRKPTYHPAVPPVTL